MGVGSRSLRLLLGVFLFTVVFQPWDTGAGASSTTVAHAVLSPSASNKPPLGYVTLEQVGAERIRLFFLMSGLDPGRYRAHIHALAPSEVCIGFPRVVKRMRPLTAGANGVVNPLLNRRFVPGTIDKLLGLEGFGAVVTVHEMDGTEVACGVITPD